MPTPSKNIHWRSIPKGAKVVDTGKLFIVGEGKDAAVAFWEGREAAEAQSKLAQLAKESKP